MKEKRLDYMWGMPILFVVAVIPLVALIGIYHTDIGENTWIAGTAFYDFFLYYILRYGYRPEKIYRLAKQTFIGRYENEVILKWLKTFYRRFFAQQFKRSCLPDGPKVGSVGVSPRGDLKMPSDACVRIWLEELEAL